MKKTAVFLLCAALLFSLAACGGSEKEPAPTPTDSPAPAPAVTDEPQTPVPSQEPAVTQAPAEPDNDVSEIIARVRDMEGEPVEDLLAWLGEPISRDYSSSCLVQGGQDGQWEYEGFTVYTLVQPDGTETVYDCE